MVVVWVFLYLFSCDKRFYPGWLIFPCHFARAAAKKIVRTPEELLKILEAENSRGDAYLTVLVFYNKNKAEHFMWIVSPADDSHVMSHLIYTVK